MHLARVPILPTPLCAAFPAPVSADVLCTTQPWPVTPTVTPPGTFWAFAHTDPTLPEGSLSDGPAVLSASRAGSDLIDHLRGGLIMSSVP